MEFTFQMNYDRKAMTAMAKAMRAGLQAEQDKKSKVIGWVFVVLAAVILVTSGKAGLTQIIGGILVACFAGYLVFNDQINGAMALWKLPAKLRQGKWLFREDGYYSVTEEGECDYSYENIFAIAQTSDYIFLVFHNKQAQILDLATIEGGTAEQFRKLLRRKTSLTIQDA